MRVSQDVLAVLSAAETAGNTLRLTGQLERKLYEQTAKVLEAAGGKWVRKHKVHMFDGSAADAIEQVLLTGEIVAAKQELGAFFTPGPLADRVIDAARLAPGIAVLEPSAGAGALASRALLAGCKVDCVEIHDKFVHLLCSTPYNAVVHNDFLSIVPVRNYDRVVMNPPFARQADIDHVLHALKFLKRGGMLVAIMSAGVEFREDRKAREFRETIRKLGGTITRLPEGSFAESGTNVNTVMVEVWP